MEKVLLYIKRHNPDDVKKRQQRLLCGKWPGADYRTDEKKKICTVNDQDIREKCTKTAPAFAKFGKIAYNTENAASGFGGNEYGMNTLRK